MEEKIEKLEFRVKMLEDFIGDLISHLNADKEYQNFSPLLSEWEEYQKSNIND